MHIHMCKQIHTHKDLYANKHTDPQTCTNHHYYVMYMLVCNCLQLNIWLNLIASKNIDI